MNNFIRSVSRGQVWFLVDPQAPAEYQGSVQGKNRPWLVVSNNYCNQNSPTYTAVPLTTARKTHLPTHVVIDDGKIEQTILCEQIRTMSANIFCSSGSYYKYTLSDKTMREVDEALSVQLGLQIVFPNSDRYWESLERLIRAQVKLAIDNCKVSAVDINAVANAINDKIVDIAKQEVSPAPNIVEQVAPRPLQLDAPTLNIPCDNEEPPLARRRMEWTDESMKEFLDYLYKYGTRETCKKYRMSVTTVYTYSGKFKKLLGGKNE